MHDSLRDVSFVVIMECDLQMVGVLRHGRVWLSRTKFKEIVFPGCILATNAGSVPHLTSETYSYIPKNLHPCGIKIPVASVINHEETIAAYPGSLSELLNLPKTSIPIISVQDSLFQTRENAKPALNTVKAISIWGNSGRIMVTPETHINLMSKLNPEVFEILADGDTTSENVSKKRITKSYSNSIKFLEATLKILNDGEKVTESLIIPALEGGNVPELRRTFSTEVLKVINENAFLSRTCGFLVDGINFDKSDEQDYCKLVQASVEQLPEDKLRFINGPQPPERIFKLLECGIDVFDTSYPTNMAQKNVAIVFAIPGVTNCENGPDSPNSQGLDLGDETHRLSFEPLLKGCSCYTCQNHTKAYIHHLVSVKELLAPILLTLHNLEHYFQFFTALRESLVKGEYLKFKSCVIDSS